MRTIYKRPPPNVYTEWRLPRMAADRPDGMVCTYAELRRATSVLEAVEDSLFAEQGGICAYTGLKIGLMQTAARKIQFHLEHLIPQRPQVYEYGKDADYSNLVACWPPPNQPAEPTFGARKKGNWPSQAEQGSFLSPTSANCGTRFTFNHRGEISATNPADDPALRTIDRLGLDNKELTNLRQMRIRGVLNPGKAKLIKLNEAEKLLKEMQMDAEIVRSGGTAQLMEFCFAVEPALEREIRKLKSIVKQSHQ